MGKNLIQQKRGRGSPSYRVPSFNFVGRICYPSLTEKNLNGKIIDIVHCPGHSSPLLRIQYEDSENIMVAPEGIKVGDILEVGNKVPLKAGNVLPLKNIPEGTPIHNLESCPGDGGKYVRSSGTFAKIVTKTGKDIIVELPSSKRKVFQGDCRATIGIIAGSGRLEKPFLKAGRKYHKMRTKNKMWPSVSGTSMNAVSHPFGGSSSAIKGRPTQSSRNAPPGRKVGKIAPRRTGRTKR